MGQLAGFADQLISEYASHLYQSPFPLPGRDAHVTSLPEGVSVTLLTSPPETSAISTQQFDQPQYNAVEYEAAQPSILNVGGKPFFQVGTDQGGHFHVPSEETSGPMCEHRIYRSAEGDLAVLMVPYVEGAAHNKALEAVLSGSQSIPMEGYLPDDRSILVTVGSLTTPVDRNSPDIPATFPGPVLWVYLREPVECSAEQLDVVRALAGHETARPLQERDNRPIYEGQLDVVMEHEVPLYETLSEPGDKRGMLSAALNSLQRSGELDSTYAEWRAHQREIEENAKTAGR